MVVATLMSLSRSDPVVAERVIQPLWSPTGSLFFFVFRLVLGLGLPFAVALLTLRAVSERASQSATGLLYVAEIGVLFGELLAAYLLV